MKPIVTLIVLAAEKELRLLRHAGTGKGLDEVVHRHAGGYPDTDVEYTGGPGRSHAAGAQFGHGDSHAEQDEERLRFAAHIVEEMSREWAGGTYDRILLAAGPRLLGVLRDRLPAALRPQVMAELDKDLVKVPIIDLPGHLDDVLAV